MRAAELAERIPGAKWVRDHWEALCRAHPDKNPPVKWKDQDDRVLVRCYAGCKTEDVLAAYGLTMADLFHHPKSQQPPGRQILRTYPYTDAAGRVVYEKVRYAPKDFRLRRPDGSGGWVWKLDGVERVLYHLDELVEQPDIHVTEGEDDTDVLRGIGLIATTNDSGADGWNDRHTAQLVAMGPRVVYVHEDNDAAGRERVATIANQVGAAAVEVRQVRYMDCGPGGDVRDALERFGAEALRARIAAAPVWAPDAENLGAGAETDEKQTEEDQGPKKTRYPEIEPLPLISVDELIDSPEPAGRFLVDRLLFDGGVSVIAGKPKAGKSTLVRTLGVAVARGATWLGRDVRQGPVVYISFEEKRGEVARLFDKLAARGLPIKTYVGKSLVNAVKALRLAIERLPEPPVLVIIDTLQKLIRVKDLNDYAPVLEALDPILNIAREIGAHICLVHHTVKGERGDPIEEVLGSTAIAGFADTVLVLKRDTHRRRTLWADGRPGVELDEIVVTLDPASQQVTSAGSKQDVDAQDIDLRVLAYLKAQKGPVTTELCKKEVEGRAEAIVTSLQRLLDRGLITRTERGKRGDPCLYSVSVPKSPPIDVDSGTETGPTQQLLTNQPLSGVNSVPGGFRSQGGLGMESADPDDPRNDLEETPAPRPRRVRPLSAEQRQAIGQDLVLTIRQGGRMTREQALAWLRGRIPHRPGHPHDAENLLDGLLVSQLDLDNDGSLIVRAKEETP